MHELSIATGILDVVVKTAEEHGLSSVTLVKTQIGELRMVFPDALSFAFEACSRNTLAENAVLEIEEVKSRAKCSGCGSEFHIDQYQFFCPECESHSITVVAGDELLVASIEGD